MDHFRQPLLQFPSRSIIRVRVTKITNEMDFFTNSRGTNRAVTRLDGYYLAVDAS